MIEPQASSRCEILLGVAKDFDNVPSLVDGRYAVTRQPWSPVGTDNGEWVPGFIPRTRLMLAECLLCPRERQPTPTTVCTAGSRG